MQRSILITGCSSGIGYTAAKILHKRGYQVIATARQPADIARLKSEGLACLPLDLNSISSIQETLHACLALTGGYLDAIFNNAGFMLAAGFEDLTPDLIAAQFNTNTFGPIELTRQVLPIMRAQGHGRIIQNSSILGLITLPYYSAYNASKAALEAFSATLRQELRGTHISISIINPGPITSNLRKTAFGHFQSNLQNQASIYKKAYEKLTQQYFSGSEVDKRLTLPPEAVVNKLIAALEDRAPKSHYYVGWAIFATALAKRLLPDSWFDYLITKI